MPDIAMCADNACPSKERCIRWNSRPSEFRQSYGQFGRAADAASCGYFWPDDEIRTYRPKTTTEILTHSTKDK